MSFLVGMLGVFESAEQSDRVLVTSDEKTGIPYRNYRASAISYAREFVRVWFHSYACNTCSSLVCATERGVEILGTTRWSCRQSFVSTIYRAGMSDMFKHEAVRLLTTDPFPSALESSNTNNHHL